MSRKSTKVCCDNCGIELQRGDWPFCPHGSVFNLNAQRFHPVTYFRDVKTGEKILPPGDDIRPPKGYVAETASTVPEIRALTKQLNFQSKERHYRYESQRLEVKRKQVQLNLEHALRAREKMSNREAQRITDYAIRKCQRQLNESAREFKPTGHFLAFENDSLRQQR